MEIPCTNITNAARSVHLLKIDGYCTAKTMGNGDCIKSRWNVGGYEWEVRIYPARTESSPDGGPWVALKLVFLTQACKSVVRANLACQLVDLPRNGLLRPSAEKSASWVFNRRQVSSPAIFLMSARNLEGSDYVKDDCLAVKCTMTVLKELVATIPARDVPVPSSNMHHHFGELLRTETGANLTILVSGQTFAAHKSILAARPPVFMAEFFGHVRERTLRCVEIKDMEPAVSKALLHFIYTDTVPELDRQQKDMTVMAQHLLAAVDRYGLDRLKLICEDKLSNGININTAAATLALADKHNCPQLKANCVRFIVSTPAIIDAVLGSEGYKHLEASCPLVLCDLLKSARGTNN